MKKLLLGILIGFLFGLTWDVSWSSPYYEIRGVVSIEQKLLGVRFWYSWSGPGFNYPPNWDIHRVKR